jgi:hypothetical protein
MVILGEMTKSRLQSSNQILAAAALPRQSKFQEKPTQKDKTLRKEFLQWAISRRETVEVESVQPRSGERIQPTAQAVVGKRKNG